MGDISFSSRDELFNRVMPALRSKKKILFKKGAKKITEQDIWDFMINNVWINAEGLELCDIVDNVLHAEDSLIIEYYHNKCLVDKK